MTRILETAEFLRFFPNERFVLVLRCNSLHDHESFYATNYPLAASAVAECVAFIAFIARGAVSLHVPCVCNAMQRKRKRVVGGRANAGKVRPAVARTYQCDGTPWLHGGRTGSVARSGHGRGRVGWQ